jgi:hypothetical protein
MQIIRFVTNWSRNVASWFIESVKLRPRIDKEFSEGSLAPVVRLPDLNVGGRNRETEIQDQRKRPCRRRQRA